MDLILLTLLPIIKSIKPIYPESINIDFFLLAVGIMTAVFYFVINNIYIKIKKASTYKNLWLSDVKNLNHLRLILTSQIILNFSDCSPSYKKAKVIRSLAKLADTDWSNSGFSLQLNNMDLELIDIVDNDYLLNPRILPSWPSQRKTFMAMRDNVNYSANNLNNIISEIPEKFNKINNLNFAPYWLKQR